VVSVIGWLLDGDPALRWQALRDLTDAPADEVAAERATLTEITRNEGKLEAARDKIVEGRMNGWFKERVLLDQSYVRDEKQTIAGMLGSACIVSFAQVVIGA